MATQTELRDAVVAALKAQEDGLLAIGRASGRAQGLASMPKSEDVLGAADALTSLVDALKGVGAADEAAKADRGLAVLRQVAKALTSATPALVAPAPTPTGLAALGKAANGTGATPTATATGHENGTTPSHSATHAVEPTGPNHASDAEVDGRLAKFHDIRANYLTPEGKPRVSSRVAYIDAVYAAVVAGAAVPAYVSSEGAAPWDKSADVAQRIVKLFD